MQAVNVVRDILIGLGYRRSLCGSFNSAMGFDPEFHSLPSFEEKGSETIIPGQSWPPFVVFTSLSHPGLFLCQEK